MPTLTFGSTLLILLFAKQQTQLGPVSANDRLGVLRITLARPPQSANPGCDIPPRPLKNALQSKKTGSFEKQFADFCSLLESRSLLTRKLVSPGMRVAAEQHSILKT